MQKHHTKLEGFTLIELAIVIVIIGLIVGSVLVGKDMISSAEIRSVINQIQSYDNARITFLGKYGQLPGDGKKLVRYGFTSGDNTNEHSDGDGVIESCNASANTIGCENILFYLNLSEAGMSKFTPNFNAAGATADEDTNFNLATDAFENYLPPLPLSSGSFMRVYSGSGINYTMMSQWIYSNPYVEPAFSPVQAQNIDRKIDDGLPNAGSMVAIERPIVTLVGDSGASGDCATGTVRASKYNTDEDNAGESDIISCALRIQM